MKKKTAIVKNIALPVSAASLAAVGAPLALQVATFVLIAAYGFFTDIFPNESKEFWERLNKAIPDIQQKIQESKEFQQALTITYEEMARTRDEKKRIIIRDFFVDGYVSSADREQIDLERYYRILQEITLDALQHLAFIEKTILPMKKKIVEEKVKSMPQGKDNSDEWWYKVEYSRISDSAIIQQWIAENYDSNSLQVKAYAPVEGTDEWKKWMNVQGDKKMHIENQFNEFTAELMSLGIFRQKANGSYTLSSFGEKFIPFVRLYSTT